MYPTDITNSKILYAVLNWGLGHASRSSVLINSLLKQGNELQLLSCGNAKRFLESEFPQLLIHNLPHFNVKYSKGRNTGLKLALQIPQFFKIARKNKRCVEQLYDENKYQYIISDNCYGAWHPSCANIFITHQIKPAISSSIKVVRNLVYVLNRRYIEQHTICWIPDSEQHSITSHFNGTLSIPKFHIGFLGRFKSLCLQEVQYDYALILSGPEPQRTILEKRLLELLKGKKLLLVRGTENAQKIHLNGLTSISIATSEKLEELIVHSEKIICRAGYSSIMDYWDIANRVILIPTPGQWEQEKLANNVKIKEKFRVLMQDELKRDDFI